MNKVLELLQELKDIVFSSCKQDIGIRFSLEESKQIEAFLPNTRLLIKNEKVLPPNNTLRIINICDNTAIESFLSSAKGEELVRSIITKHTAV